LFERFPELIQGLQSNDLAKQLECTKEFRRILSKEKNPPIAEVIETGVVPIFVAFVAGPQGQPDQTLIELYEQLQFEAAWALTNIASGTSEQTQVVINNGAVPVFVQCLYSNSPDIQEQAVWALGNIAGDSPRCRDYVLSCNILQPLLELLNNAIERRRDYKISMIRNASWTLSNLCRGKQPCPDWSTVSPCLPVLNRLLYSDDEEVLTDTCWAISYLSDGPNERIDDVIRAGVVPRLVQLLMHSSHAVQTPALRSIGNIVTGDDVQTQTVLESGALSAILSLLSSTKPGIVKEACWTVSNITAGTHVQIDQVINANLIPPIINLLREAEFKIQKEACWAISNASSQCETHPYQTQYLVEQGCIEPLCRLLKVKDARIVLVALDGLSNILKVGEMKKATDPDHINRYAFYIEEANGVDTITELQNHEKEEIYRQCHNIINKYYGNTEMEFGGSGENFNFTGAQVPQGGFNF
jgi:hypothetical protein